ncbi:MAG: hypothetical protein AAF725_03850 [Acidobacteriota bacterium]
MTRRARDETHTMNEDPEDLLWQLPQGPTDGSGEKVRDEELIAYAEGRLPAQDRLRLEERLARDPALRGRWLKSQGTLRRPSPELRRRVLEARPSPGRRFSGPPRWAAAAALFLALGMAWLLGPDRGGSASVPRHLVSVQGLAEQRTAEETAPRTAEAAAFLNTRVVIEAEILEIDDAPESLVYAVYRLEGERFRKLPEDALLLTRGPGAVRIEGAALDLVGSDLPGTYRLLLVVAREGRLPNSPPLDVTSSEKAGRGWLAYDIRLRLLKRPNDP